MSRPLVKDAKIEFRTTMGLRQAAIRAAKAAGLSLTEWLETLVEKALKKL